MAPIAFVTMTEHIGHLMVLNKLTKRNFFEEPGLHKTLTGDGLAQIVAAFVGGPPVTSYGENIGVLAITRVHSVFVIGELQFCSRFGIRRKIKRFDFKYPWTSHLRNQFYLVWCHCSKRNEDFDREQNRF